MPGANERALEKAQTIPADALILDLEDAVAPDAKPEARERVCAAATSGAYGSREIAIRANGIGTAVARRRPRRHRRGRARRRRHPEDQHAPTRCTRSRRPSRPAGRPTTRASGRCSRRRSRCSPPTRSPTSSDRLAVLVMGTNDLAKELQAAHVPGRQPLLAGPRPLPARRPGRRQGDPRRRLQRHQGRGRLPRRVRAGPRPRLRRQDAHPPEPGRAVQRHLRPDARRTSSKAGRIIAAFEEAEADGRGRRHRRRPHGREPARGAGPPHPRHPARRSTPARPDSGRGWSCRKPTVCCQHGPAVAAS